MTTGVILQPSYLPWRGYFHQIQRADAFVFYDDVQYDKGGWRNRNRIPTAQGPIWLTVPIQRAPLETAIKDVLIDYRADWVGKHRRSIEHAYARAPYLSELLAILDPAWRAGHARLADLTIDLTVRIAAALGLTSTTFCRSSELGIVGSQTGRIVAICQHLGVDHYLSGPSARAYLDEAALAGAGIELEYMTYAYRDYPQLRQPFEPQVSIVDLIALLGPRAGEHIWGDDAGRNRAA